MARPYLALLLVPYVLLSSLLGLAGRFLLDFGNALDFFVHIWATSLAADLVFVAGSVLGGLVAWQLARRHALASVAAAFALHALTYVASFSVLVNARSTGLEDLQGMVAFVVPIGIVGLAFASVSPALARKLLKEPSEAADPAAA